MAIVKSGTALGGRRSDILLGSDLDDVLSGGGRTDFLFGGEGIDQLSGGNGGDFLFGGNGNDSLDGGNGGDFLFGGSGSDTILTGRGHDLIGFAGDPFDGADVSAAGRQVIGNEDFVGDFNFHQDAYLFDGDDFQVGGDVHFVSVDATAPGADIAKGANVIVLLNSDNDNNAATPFNAGAAANQIAGLVEDDGAGFFVYFNSDLQLNRLVWSSNLNDATADLKIISRQTDLTGQDAIDALAAFSEDNFIFLSDGESFDDVEDVAFGEAFDDVDAGVIPVVAELSANDFASYDLAFDAWA